jgi:hypothetical protein
VTVPPQRRQFPFLPPLDGPAAPLPGETLDGDLHARDHENARGQP